MIKQAILNPMVSVGYVCLGEDIKKYPNARHEYRDKAGDYPYHCYSFTDIAVLAYTDEEGTIESISCSTECVWQGVNLIGLDYKQFKALYPVDPNGSDSFYVMIGTGEQLQDQYDYDGLGIQIWVFDQKIVTVSASAYEEQ